MGTPSRFGCIFLLIGAAISAQTPGNQSLNGRFWIRHLMLLTDSGGTVTEARTFAGFASFDGTGRYTCTGQLFTGAAAAAGLNVAGTYSVESSGIVLMSNPLRNGVNLNARLGSAALVGSSTESAGVFDLLIAVPAPAGGQSNAALNGSFHVSLLEFPVGSTAQVRGAFFRLTSSGAGSFSDVAVSGHAANLGSRILQQTVAAATYSIAADGTGTSNFPLATGFSASTQILNGAKSLAISADGNILLGSPSFAGTHGLLIGVRAPAGDVTNADWRDRFVSAGLRIENNRPAVFSGSAFATGAGKVVWSRRVRQIEGVIDFTGATNYSLSADGTGTLETSRVALGAAGNAFAASGASVADSNNYELFFGGRAAAATGSGVFLNPQGVVNAASFAPFGSPVSPGELITLFGAGMAPATAVTPAIPFPTTLGGVQVLVNNVPAPVYAVSPTQISALVPYSASGGTASIVVNNNNVRSNTVTVPLARTAPGIFTVPPGGIGPGAIQHADYTLVSAASPASRGEVVLVYLTGLGSVTPAVPDGAAGPANPLSLVNSGVKVYIGGREASIQYKGLAPGLPGLYQLNIQVPSNAPLGAGVPLAIETPDAFHDQADIAVTQ